MTGIGIDTIVATLEGGNALAAERMCRQRLGNSPNADDLLVLLALSLWRQGDRDAALEIYARLTCLHPEDAVHWRNYATALRQAGDLETSEHAFQQAARLAPDDAGLLESHGVLLLQLGKPQQARDTLLRAFGLSPDSPSIRIHAAQACSACRDYRTEQLVKPWREWLPLEVSLQFELAELLTEMSEAEKAVALFEDLVRRMPGDRQLRLRLASVYERVNRLGDAEALLEGTAAEATGSDAQETCEIGHQRAQLAARRRQYTTARAMLERVGPRSGKDYAHWFALAHACDKSWDAPAAMRALTKAHALQIDELRLSVPHLFEPDAVVLPNAQARVSATEYQNWPNLEAPDASHSPVFVVGFPRSGTTLLEQMLDAHPHLQSMDERPFFNMLSSQLERSTGLEVPRDLRSLDQRDCDELRKGYLILACGKVPRRWDARLVDKNPLNMLWLPMIHRMFPRAKFIVALRHPCDVILSCYMQNFRAAVLAVAGRSLEQLARAYVAAMESWLYHVEVFKPDVFVSRYEDLVADTPGQTQRIACFLGLDDAESMLRFDAHAREKGYIKTPSYTQVIEPINARGLGRWQRYREYFESVLPILGPMLDHWEYAADGRAALRKH